MTEQLTSRYRTDRIENLYQHRPLDRVAFVHRGYGFCAKNVGFPIADIYEDPSKSYTAQDRTIEQYESDGTPFYTFVSYGAWEFGGDIAWPDDRYGSGPSVSRRPVQSPEDLDALSLPDVEKAGALPRMMEFAHLQQANGDPIAFICGSPFTHAANLCGVENFLLWTATEPELVHKALRLMTDHILEVAAHYIDVFGPGNVLARSAAPTDGLLSPDQFNQFALPYLKELHSKVLEMGASSIYCHICGEQNHLLEQWAEVPFGDPGMLSFGHEIDLTTAAQHFPEHIIAGNVNPQIIASGTPTEIMQASEAAIEKGKKCPGGYVFMGGCELPPSTPPYNIYLMQEAVRHFGQY
ncbi:MAG: uroporphyrinogen decarboxylase family protein [Anaerolineales bacterium]|jgi:uroporphyrinogen decarboxylase